MKNLKILKNFFIYSAGAIILKLIMVFIGLMAINFLTPAEFGLMALLNTFINVFPIFLSLGLRQAFSLDFFHSDNTSRKKMINDIITIYLSLAIPILFFMAINLKLINKYIFLNQADHLILLIALLICFSHFFTELFFQTLRYQYKALTLSSLQIFMALINLFSAFILIYFFRLKIIGIVLANFISMIFAIFFGFYLYLKKIGHLRFEFLKNKEIFFYYLKLGSPFIPSILFNWLMTFGDRWILANFVSMHEVGIYSLAASFGQFYQMTILYPLTGSYTPYIFEKFGNDKKNILATDRWNQKNMWLAMIIMIALVSSSFLLFKNFFYLFLPINYHRSIPIIFLILFQQIIFMGSYFATCYIQFLKKTYIYSGLIVFSGIINVILNFLLIPYFAVYGTILSTTVSYSIYLGLILLVTNILKKKNAHLMI